MTIPEMITQIAKKENTEAKFVYGKYYKIFAKKYPDVDLKKESSKIKSIKSQGYEDKLSEIIIADNIKLVEEIKVELKDFTDKQKIKIFEKELNFIGGLETNNDINDDIKHFVIRALLSVPEYFFIVPASSSGKYHPDFASGNSGLLKHTKALIQVLKTLFDVEHFEFNERARGITVASGILHDTLKHGLEHNPYSDSKHPLIVVEFLKKFVNLEDFPEKDFDKMCSLISSHMGKWNTDYKTKKEILPKPQTKGQILLHIADLIASRKWTNFDFSKDFNELKEML